MAAAGRCPDSSPWPLASRTVAFTAALVHFGAMRASVPTKPKPVARLRVGFVLARHFTLTAFANFIDTLRLAADDGDRSRQVHCQWTVMSSTRSPIVSSSGIAITPESDFIDPAQFHYIVVVGGLLHRGEPIDQATEAYLRRAAEAGTVLIGVCTGSFILTRLGVLKGRKVCVSWYHRNDYVDEFGGTPVADRLYVIDGNRITCSGGAGVPPAHPARQAGRRIPSLSDEWT